MSPLLGEVSGQTCQQSENFFSKSKALFRALLAGFAVFNELFSSFLNFFLFFMILELTLLGWEAKKEEIFDKNSYEAAYQYEAEILFLSGRRLPLRGGGAKPKRS